MDGAYGKSGEQVITAHSTFLVLLLLYSHRLTSISKVILNNNKNKWQPFGRSGEHSVLVYIHDASLVILFLLSREVLGTL